MPPSLLTAVAFSALFTTGLLARPNAFLVTGPVELVGQPGETVRGTYWCMLSADHGLVADVAGWSFEIAPATADLRIVSVTSSSTDAERAFGGGVLSSELTPEGAVVGNAQIDPVLPGVLDDVYREVYLARLTVEAEIPAERELSSRLEFVGTPTATWRDGTSAALTPVDLSVVVRPIRNCCFGSAFPPNPEEPFSVGFARYGVGGAIGDNPFRPLVPPSDVDCAASSGRERILEVRPGDFGEIEVYFVSVRAKPLVRWTVAAAVEGDAVVTDVTGYSFDSDTPFAAVVDGSRNGGISGGVSEFTPSVPWGAGPAVRWLFSLRLRTIEVQPPDRDLVARVYVQDGLQVGERPHFVNSLFSEDGQPVRPCNAGTASATVRFTPPRQFIRGDSNGDGIVDMSDAIYTMEYLYQGGPEPSCLAAANANDLWFGPDLGAAILTLAFLFQGLPDLWPPGAFACGEDPTLDEVSCLEYPHCP